MIPELVIAMLACARIGAIHTAIFSGYAEGGVRSRIQGSKAKVVITADAAIRAGKIEAPQGQPGPHPGKVPLRGPRGGGEPRRPLRREDDPQPRHLVA